MKCERCGAGKATYVVGLYPLRNEDDELCGMLDAMACAACAKLSSYDWFDVTTRLLESYKETPPAD